MSRHDADLIIAGAGCAGLSALWQLLHLGGDDRRVIVVDRDFAVRDDRTWSFWGSVEAPFMGVADRTWNRVEVRFPESVAAGRLAADRVYARVRSRDYIRAVLDAASAHPNVEFVESDIGLIDDGPTYAEVHTSTGTLRAPIVFQSVRPSPSDATAPVRHPLRQHFGGWEVRTERPVFDPDVVTLMDFDTAQHGGTAFVYVLPDAPDRALVEHTMFSVVPRDVGFHERQLHHHLARLGAGAFTVERTEYGIIPMEDRRYHQRWGRHIWNLGVVGGMTKPSTGYTFQRTHAQTRHLVATMLDHGAPEPLPDAPGRFRLADRALLHILHHRPDLSRPIFERLFRTSELDEVLTFLDEDSSVLDDARMMARLPWSPFLRAVGAEAVAMTATRVRRRRPAVSRA